MTVRVDPLWLAQSKFRRKHHEECVEICNEALSKNAYDQVCVFVIVALLSSASNFLSGILVSEMQSLDQYRLAR